MKVMGLDVGSKTIGVAISDAFGWTAQGLTTIKWNESDIRSADPLLKKIVAEHEVEQIVIGLPKHMNGSIGDRGLASQTYATHVEKIHQIPAFLWDERLSTVAAEKVLIEADVSRKKRKTVIDKVAAVMILQGFLDQSSRGV